jgi:excisionase family DNA binding protein
MEQKLLTIAEAADRLRVRARTVRRWVSLRKIEYVKAGKSVRIAEEEIGRIVREGTVRREKALCPEWPRLGVHPSTSVTLDWQVTR